MLEAVRAEGTSPWYAAGHDEAAIVMDGEVEIRLMKPDDQSLVPNGQQGSIALEGQPAGRKMGTIKTRRGHMALSYPQALPTNFTRSGLR